MNESTDEFPGTPAEWLAKAREDLTGAQVLMQSGKRLADLVTYHSQQAVEKALKAVLRSRGVRFPKTHSIESLAGLVDASGIEPPPEIENAVTLTEFAAGRRYPWPGEPPTPEEQRDAVATARRIVDWAESVIGSSGDAG